MTIGELIERLTRLSRESPHGHETVVLLKFEGDLEIRDACLGKPQLPGGRTLASPVVLIRARTARRTVPMRMERRGDRSEEDADDPPEPDAHAEMTRIRLCRALRRRLGEVAAECGERSHPLGHLLGVLEADRLSLPGKGKGDGQLWLFDERPEADFARARRICEATGARVIHSGGGVAVYQYGRDAITMPALSRYRDAAAYYTMRFHLTMHWAEKRLGWEGDPAQGKLVAVLGSYLLAEAARIRVRDIRTSREFDADWLREIRRDPGYLRRALSQATEAAEFILAMGNG